MKKNLEILSGFDMPELPEVETVRRQLSKEVVGSKVANIIVREAKIFMGNPNELYGDKIVKVERIGKYLFVYFKSKKGLIIHLKMTGRLIIRPLNQSTIKPLEVDYETAKHTRVVIKLSDGRKIFYWDTRKFGYLKLVDDIHDEYLKLSEKMGPDPWKITEIELMRKLKRTARSIKEAILDQNVLSGVGNIYANDVLWLAKINPFKKSNILTKTEVKNLRQSLHTVLERGLVTNGASDNTYRDLYGERGSYQDEFLVYGRTGEPCNRCSTPLKRIVVGGRGTWVCNKCQMQNKSRPS